MMSNSTFPGRPCRSCGKPLHDVTLDMGNQPLCNRFLVNFGQPEYVHPLALGVCPSCCLLQMLEPFPVEEVAPRFPWIMYNEPEGHLDHLAGLILEMAKNPGSMVAGISYKDDTTLKRLCAKGMNGGWRITPEELGLNLARVEVETLQDRLTKEKACEIGKRHGSVNVLLVRHILEHAYDTGSFLEALKLLVKPDGLIVFEVPDCTTALTLKDYSMIWEEHILYFTPGSLKACLELHGFEVLRLENYPYPLENSLVVIARPARTGHLLSLSGKIREMEMNRPLDYFKVFPVERERYRQVFSEYRNHGKKIALLGAGHLACVFINLFGLQGYVECVLDDDSNRQGMFMPGSKLPIKSTACLQDKDISLCLLSLNPVNEEKAMARQQGFTGRGGEFKSIFRASRHAIRRQG